MNPNPLQASPTNLTATPVSTPLPAVRKPPQPHPRVSYLRASTACLQCRSPHPWASSAEVPRGRQPAGYGSVLAVGAPSTVIFIPWTPTRMLAPRLVPARLMTTPC